MSERAWVHAFPQGESDLLNQYDLVDANFRQREAGGAVGRQPKTGYDEWDTQNSLGSWASLGVQGTAFSRSQTFTSVNWKPKPGWA